MNLSENLGSNESWSSQPHLLEVFSQRTPGSRVWYCVQYLSLYILYPLLRVSVNHKRLSTSIYVWIHVTLSAFPAVVFPSLMFLLHFAVSSHHPQDLREMNPRMVPWQPWWRNVCRKMRSRNQSRLPIGANPIQANTWMVKNLQLMMMLMMMMKWWLSFCDICITRESRCVGYVYPYLYLLNYPKIQIIYISLYFYMQTYCLSTVYKSYGTIFFANFPPCLVVPSHSQLSWEAGRMRDTWSLRGSIFYKIGPY